MDVLDATRTDLVIVGPEAPLVEGLADECAAQGVPCFGPLAAAAQLEASKSWAKEVMLAAGVLTAEHHTLALSDPELDRVALAMASDGVVLKADGLAGGKGVFVCDDADDVRRALIALRAHSGSAAERIVVEERLTGPETSVFGITDGTRVIGLPSSRDHKRLLDGAKGPNTGGMGAIAPDPNMTAEGVKEVLRTVHEPVLAELRRRGLTYRGVLYAGIMLTPKGPRVLEFNVRFGDPECQALMALWTDPLRWLYGAANGTLPDGRPQIAEASSCCVVLAARGYPTHPRTGAVIPAPQETSSSTVFQAAVAQTDGALTVAGGRVLGATGWGSTAEQARARAYAAAETVRFDGAHLRSDIGL
ncbi:MAG: phosphoribosylamine--glycine ligase [Myxococcota bacterium]